MLSVKVLSLSYASGKTRRGKLGRALFTDLNLDIKPGETVQMPVTFYVDPEIVNDRDGKYVKSITLSYTFYETDLPSEQVNLDQTVDAKPNTAVN